MNNPSKSAPAGQPAITYANHTADLHQIAWDFIKRLEEDGQPLDMPTLIALTGDRLTCCTEIIAAHAASEINGQTRQRIAGLCSLAPDGEMQSGQPTIVGVAVRPDFQRSGIGRELLGRGIARLRELIADRDPEARRILIEAVSTNGKRLTQSVLRQEAEAADIEFLDHSALFQF
ncbi:MAG: GNAT family N-acetyltransferase [Candidatus Peribacteraceae bacterium]|nr:GNAT family N-acetyltransferase [Candidatus Peribacteraceae bacterium]